MLKLLLLPLFLLVSATSKAQALILIEPTVGYVDGQFVSTSNLGVEEKIKISGPQGGLQIQVLTGFILVGVEGQYLSGKYKPETGASSDLKVTDAYAQLGFHSNRFRLWGSYGVSNSYEVESTSTKTKYTGSNIKISASYLITNHFNFGLQYVMRDFNKSIDSAGVETTIGENQTKKKVVSNDMGAYISFPF